MICKRIAMRKFKTKNRRDIENIEFQLQEMWSLISEKHEMILEDRRKIEEVYRLISEKHEMIAEDRARIEEVYRLICEKHEMIVEDRKRIEDVYRLISEKHEMIMADRKDIKTVMKYAITEYWNKKEKTQEQAEILKWLDNHEVKMYPYEWMDAYMQMDVKVERDGDWRYVLHKGKKMYFPKSYDENKIKQYYKFLIMEQDERSPHCYFSEKFVQGNEHFEVWMDVGGAEGILTLENIDMFERAYVIECEEDWIEALNKTFESYDKVTIIGKIADTYTDESHIALKDLTGGKKCFVKMDVEGYEMNVLAGLDLKQMGDKSKLIVCAYHHQNDEKEIGKYLTKNGVQFQHTKGYLLSAWGGYEEPFLRRGLIRCNISK